MFEKIGIASFFLSFIMNIIVLSAICYYYFNLKVVRVQKTATRLRIRKELTEAEEKTAVGLDTRVWNNLINAGAGMSIINLFGVIVFLYAIYLANPEYREIMLWVFRLCAIGNVAFSFAMGWKIATDYGALRNILFTEIFLKK